MVPRWIRIAIATVVPLAAGALAWGVCAAVRVDGDATGIIVGLVVLIPGTPLAIWAGQSRASAARTDASGDPSTNALARLIPEAIGDIPRQPRAFQPRSEVHRRIAETLGRDGVCALVGARGVGKTHLAAAYSRSCIDRGVAVAWLNAETEGQLSASLDLMALDLGLRTEADDSAAVARKLRRWLEERREAYLVVLDNASAPDDLAAILPSRGAANVLITGNDSAFERIATTIQIERFTTGEALAYLNDRAGVGADPDAELLVQELDRLPLALSIACAALVGPPRLTCLAYLDELRTTSVEVLLGRPRGEPYPRGVAQAILLSVAGAGNEAVELLGELTLLSASGVGLVLLGPDARQALTDLNAHSLISFSDDGSTVMVHRLVRRVIRDKADREGTLAALTDAAARRLEVVKDIPDADTWRMLPTIMAIAEHAATLWEAVEQLPSDAASEARSAAERVLRTRHAVAVHLLYLNDGTRAVPIAKAVAEGRESTLGADHPETLDARYTLAHAYEYAGQAAQAVTLLQDLVTQQARVLGEMAPQTLRSRSGMASALTTAGRADDAVTILEEVVEEQSRILSPDHADLRISRFFHAYAMVPAGQPARAAELFAALLQDQERVLGAEHPETLVIRGRLAWAYLAAGRFGEAVRLYEQVYAAQERIIGADHTDTLITGHGLASAYEAAGRLADALSLYRRVEDRFESILGPDQTWTITAKGDVKRVGQILNGA